MDESYADLAVATPTQEPGHESLREALDDAYSTAMRLMETVGLLDEDLSPVLTPRPESVPEGPTMRDGTLRVVTPRASATQQAVDIEQQLRAVTRRVESLRGRLNL